MKIYLYEPMERVRADIVSAGASLQMHVEPFEDLCALVKFAPQRANLLLHDDRHFTYESLNKALASRGLYGTVVAYSDQVDIDRAIAATRADVEDFITGYEGSGDLLERAISSFQRAGPAVGEKRAKAMAKQKVSQLTGREREVLVEMLDGESNKGIAKRLGISSRTVEIHRANMISKLGADNAISAARIGWEAGLASDGSPSQPDQDAEEQEPSLPKSPRK